MNCPCNKTNLTIIRKWNVQTNILLDANIYVDLFMYYTYVIQRIILMRHILNIEIK